MVCALCDCGLISLVESSDGCDSAARSLHGSLYRSCRTRSLTVGLVLGSAASLSSLLSSPWTASFSSPHLSWLPPSPHISSHCGHQRAIPRCLSWCLSISCLACRHPWNAELDGRLVDVQKLVHHTWCLWVCAHRPSCVRDRAIANVAGRAWDVCWGSSFFRAPRCWWPCPATWRREFVVDSECGSFPGGSLVWSMLSRIHCRTVGYWVRTPGRLWVWCWKWVAYWSTLSCSVVPWRRQLWRCACLILH